MKLFFWEGGVDREGRSKKIGEKGGEKAGLKEVNI
jgi:hypothetical protein